MNRNEPLTDLKTAGPDGLDRLLSSFFKSEMPSSWPTPPVEVVSRPMPASRMPVQRSVLTGPRASLAVSVALLLGGCWLLSGRTVDAPVPSRIGAGLEDGSADTKKRPHKIPARPERPIIKPMMP